MRSFLLFATLFIIGSSNVYSSEFRAAIGFGFQYGGVFGWQGSIVEDRQRGSIGIGIVGASIGYDYKLNEKFSVGTAVSATSLGLGGWSAGTLRLHYYLDGTFKTGWVYGLEVFRTFNTWSIYGSSDDENFTRGFFSLGYGYK